MNAKIRWYKVSDRVFEIGLGWDDDAQAQAIVDLSYNLPAMQALAAQSPEPRNEREIGDQIVAQFQARNFYLGENIT